MLTTITKTSAAVFACLVAASTIGACGGDKEPAEYPDDDDTMEEAGEEVDEAADEAQEEIDEAGDEVEDETD